MLSPHHPAEHTPCGLFCQILSTSESGEDIRETQTRGAVAYARGFLASGILALFAIALPPAVGMGRNFLSWWKASKQPPLQPGHEFDGWSEVKVTSRVTIWQCAMVLLSAVLFFGLALIPVYSAIGSKPEGILKEWHYFERQCPQPPSDPGGV